MSSALPDIKKKTKKSHVRKKKKKRTLKYIGCDGVLKSSFLKNNEALDASYYLEVNIYLLPYKINKLIN